MFNKLLTLTILSLFLVGCNLTGGTKTAEEKPETTTEKPAEEKPAGIKEGDTVVARWSGNSFYEGKVESIDGSKMKIKWNDGSNPSDVDKSDIYELPKDDAKPDVKVGDMVLAKISTSSYWNGAEITNIDGDVYKVKAIGSSNETNLDANKIIKVSSATAANLKDKAGSSDFLKQARSKKPDAPASFKAKKGDKVLAQWVANSWYSGKVNDVKGNKVTIAWDDNSKPSAVDADKVLPYPNASNTKMPTENQYVLVKPASGSKWTFAQTVSVKDKDIEVKDSKGATRTVKAGEAIPLN